VGGVGKRSPPAGCVSGQPSSRTRPRWQLKLQRETGPHLSRLLDHAADGRLPAVICYGRSVLCRRVSLGTTTCLAQQPGRVHRRSAHAPRGSFIVARQRTESRSTFAFSDAPRQRPPARLRHPTTEAFATRGADGSTTLVKRRPAWKIERDPVVPVRTILADWRRGRRRRPLFPRRAPPLRRFFVTRGQIRRGSVAIRAHAVGPSFPCASSMRGIRRASSGVRFGIRSDRIRPPILLPSNDDNGDHLVDAFQLARAIRIPPPSGPASTKHRAPLRNAVQR